MTGFTQEKDMFMIEVQVPILIIKAPQGISQVWGSLLQWRWGNTPNKKEKELPNCKILKFIWEIRWERLSGRRRREALRAKRVLHLHETRRHCVLKRKLCIFVSWYDRLGLSPLSATLSDLETCDLFSRWGLLSKKALRPPFSRSFSVGHLLKRVRTHILHWYSAKVLPEPGASRLGGDGTALREGWGHWARKSPSPNKSKQPPVCPAFLLKVTFQGILKHFKK